MSQPGIAALNKSFAIARHPEFTRGPAGNAVTLAPDATHMQRAVL